MTKPDNFDDTLRLCRSLTENGRNDEHLVKKTDVHQKNLSCSLYLKPWIEPARLSNESFQYKRIIDGVDVSL